MQRKDISFFNELVSWDFCSNDLAELTECYRTSSPNDLESTLNGMASDCIPLDSFRAPSSSQLEPETDAWFQRDPSDSEYPTTESGCENDSEDNDSEDEVTSSSQDTKQEDDDEDDSETGMETNPTASQSHPTGTQQLSGTGANFPTAGTTSHSSQDPLTLATSAGLTLQSEANVLDLSGVSHTGSARRTLRDERSLR